jgi:hypothetical protein
VPFICPDRFLPYVRFWNLESFHGVLYAYLCYKRPPNPIHPTLLNHPQSKSDCPGSSQRHRNQHTTPHHANPPHAARHVPRSRAAQVPASDIRELAAARQHSGVGADIRGGGAEGAEIRVAFDGR